MLILMSFVQQPTVLSSKESIKQILSYLTEYQVAFGYSWFSIAQLYDSSMFQCIWRKKNLDSLLL